MSHVCFCNWNRVGGGFDSCHIFELPESHSYDLIFFDPLGFAVDNQFIPGPKEYWVKRFVSLDEADLLTYIAAAKRTALRLRDFLDNGGALIIRS
ncbi:MAG TPA: hypothetical protein VLB27_06295, partial [candidate division Zixibacteria bacterium]|nr:hypothetical protein [candidate division Zixibacteria bacterium]